jgi:zinc/manganese transport system substrate-binding protein
MALAIVLACVMRMILNFVDLPDRRILLRVAAVPALAAGLSFSLAACGGDEGGGSADPTVVASTTEAADLARNVAGDRAEVIGILAPNSDPHDYEPRPSDAESIAEADLVVQSGGDLDLWLDDVVESSGTDAPVTTLIDSVETIEGATHEHEDEHSAEEEDAEEEETDPHWWEDPRNAILAVEAIRDGLIEVDPAGRRDYEANADDYIARLEDLDAQIADCMQGIPPGERKLVTSHDALGYFAERYDIEVVGAAIPALTTQAQPSAGETAELVDLIRSQGVNAIFPEAGVNTDLEQAIADETGAEIGGELWADTLGPEGSGAETYLEAMAANATTLAKGFSGRERGCAFAGVSGP